VRIVRLTLLEKGVDHDQVPVDVFAAEGLPDWYLDIHPFGRIPALDHDGFRIFETTAIARYVDEGFDGPALQPTDARKRAAMNQIVALLDAYAYRSMVWDIYVETIEKTRDGGEIDRARVAAAIPVAEKSLAALAKLKTGGRYLLGDQLSLADLHAAPILAFLARTPVAPPMIGRHAELQAWWERMQARPSFAATQPTR
jgi:glutathione S-transferase